jgi:hypothetical protein
MKPSRKSKRDRKASRPRPARHFKTFKGLLKWLQAVKSMIASGDHRLAASWQLKSPSPLAGLLTNFDYAHSQCFV